MATQRLEIEISSEVQGTGTADAAKELSTLQKEAQEASTRLITLTKDVRTLANAQQAFIKAAKEGSLTLRNQGADVAFVGKGVGQLTTINEKYAKSNNVAAQSLQKLTTSSGSAYGAISGLTNIIRDAPYGIVGIGNNITQLSDAFGQLQRQTGSASGALKALFGGILSPGGLISLGLSTAVTLWTLYSQRQQKAASEAKKAADEIKKVGDILGEGADNLRQYNASAQAEIVTLNGLLKIAGDETRSREQRTNALKALKEQTKGYLNDLTLETANTDKARKALDEYNKSLFQSALIKAYQGEIDDLAKSFAQQGKAVQTLGAQIDQVAAKRQQALQPGVNVDLQKAADLQLQENRLINERTAALQEQQRAQAEIYKLGGQIADITSQIKVFNKEDLKEVEKKYTAYQNLTKILSGDQISFRAIGPAFDLSGITEFREGVLSLATVVDDSLKNVDKAAQSNLSKINTKFTAQIDEFSKQVAKIANVNLVNGISSISEAIGEAIVSGNAGGILKAFVSSISNFLTELGTTLIATGVGIEAFKASLQSLQGGAAIAAGAALIVAAGAFRALAANSFATGGTAYGPQMAIIGDNPARKEHILSDTQLEDIAGGARWDGGQLVGVLRGQDLMIVVERAGRNERRSRG